MGRKAFIVLIVFNSFSLQSQELQVTDGTLNYKENPIEEAYKIELDSLNSDGNFTTQGWIELEVKYLKIWDNQLNSLYKRLLSSLDGKRKSILVDSQRSWLEHYNKKSDFLLDLISEGDLSGSGSRALYYNKLLNEKRRRVYEFIEYCHILDIDRTLVYKGSSREEQ